MIRMGVNDEVIVFTAERRNAWTLPRELEVTRPATDGTVEFAMDVDSCGCVGTVSIHLPVDERRALIKWLQANTPGEGTNELLNARPGTGVAGAAAGATADATGTPTSERGQRE